MSKRWGPPVRRGAAGRGAAGSGANARRPPLGPGGRGLKSIVYRSSAGSSVLQFASRSGITDRRTESRTMPPQIRGRLRDDALDEHLMAEHRRLHLGADVALDRQVIEVAAILAEPARHRARVAHDRAADEADALARRRRRGRPEAECQNAKRQRSSRSSHQSTPRKLTRSVLSCSVKRMLKRRS